VNRVPQRRFNTVTYGVSVRVIPVSRLGVAECFLKKTRNIAQSMIDLGIVHQVLNLVIGFRPRQAVVLLRLNDHTPDTVQLIGKSPDIGLRIGITGSPIRPGERQKGGSVGIGGVRVAGRRLHCAGDVVIICRAVESPLIGIIQVTDVPLHPSLHLRIVGPIPGQTDGGQIRVVRHNFRRGKQYRPIRQRRRAGDCPVCSLNDVLLIIRPRSLGEARHADYNQ